VSFKQQVGRALLPRLPVTRFLFDQLRTEAAARSLAVTNIVSPSRRRRLSQLAARRGLLVNVACGPHVLEGFINLDLHPAAAAVIAWDCRTRLPLGDASAAGIRAEHFIEHLEAREELPSFLADCFRALQPGGVLRAIVPDAGRFLHAYCDPATDAFHALAVPDPFPDDLPTRMDVINHVFHQWHEHRWAYDFETIAHRLRRAGFSAVAQTRFRCSTLPALAADRDVHAPYSLYVDAVKPR